MDPFPKIKWPSADVAPRVTKLALNFMQILRVIGGDIIISKGFQTNL